MFSLARIIFRPKVYFEDGSSASKAVLDGPCLIVSNHINHLDGTILAYLFRKYTVHNLAAKDRFEQGGFVRWYLENSGCIPIDRVGVSTDWLHTSIKVLRQDKESIIIFPEGRHGENREILPFHSGVTMIAAMSASPMVMVYIDGPYKFGRHCRVMMSNPFTLPAPEAGMTAEYVAEQTEALRTRMLDLQSKLDSFIK